jgi:hypothetical protein
MCCQSTGAEIIPRIYFMNIASAQYDDPFYSSCLLIHSSRTDGHSICIVQLQMEVEEKLIVSFTISTSVEDTTTNLPTFYVQRIKNYAKILKINLYLTDKSERCRIFVHAQEESCEPLDSQGWSQANFKL